MPRLFIEYLEGENIYMCKRCKCHLTSLSELISEAFRGQSGTAYLFNNAYHHPIISDSTSKKASFKKRNFCRGFTTSAICSVSNAIMVKRSGGNM